MNCIVWNFQTEEINLLTDWVKNRIKDNDGWGCQYPPNHIIDVEQQAYYAPDFAKTGHGRRNLPPMLTRPSP